MTILWINLIVVFVTAFFARYTARVSDDVNAVVPIKPNKTLISVSAISLIAISGLRRNIGDTFNYRNIYMDNDFTWEYIFSGKDYGFGILQMILKRFVSEDPQVMLFTTALITNLIIVIIFYKYSRFIEISLYVYITGGLFLVSMNGIRQVLAAAIAFTAIRFLIKRDLLKYSLVVILASFFHQSALVLLPMFFLARYKAWSKSTAIVIILAIGAVIGFEQFTSLLFTALEDTQYGEYENFDEQGANVLRSIVISVPLIIAYLGRNRLREIFPNSDYIINMSVFGLVFMIISTQAWIFARISIYFELYQLILISWIIKLVSKRDQRILYYGIIVCYFLYYYYETVINLNIEYRSNYLIW